jgi:hypothetical protein
MLLAWDELLEGQKAKEIRYERKIRKKKKERKKEER